MADGSTQPIAEVNVGDEVATTNPETGEHSDQQVTLLHANRDTELTDVTVSTAPTTADRARRTVGEGEGDRSTRGPTESTLETTAHHPFWDATTGQWVNAADLTAGTSTLVGPDGQIQYVTAVRNYTGTKVMRDLTVATTHTYYVLASDEPVLVHNNDNFFCEAKADVAQLREQEGLLTPDAEDALYAEQEAAGVPKSQRVKKNTRGRLDIVNATFHGKSGVNGYAGTYPGKGHHLTAVSFK